MHIPRPQPSGVCSQSAIKRGSWECGWNSSEPPPVVSTSHVLDEGGRNSFHRLIQVAQRRERGCRGAVQYNAMWRQVETSRRLSKCLAGFAERWLSLHEFYLILFQTQGFIKCPIHITLMFKGHRDVKCNETKKGVKSQRKEGSFPPVMRQGLVERKVQRHGKGSPPRECQREPGLSRFWSLPHEAWAMLIQPESGSSRVHLPDS